MNKYQIIYKDKHGEPCTEDVYAVNKVRAYEVFAQFGYDDITVLGCVRIIEYIAKIEIPQQEINRINHLLGILSLEDMSDEELLAEGANTNYHEGVYFAEFENGASIRFDLCSGVSNYWDDVVFTYPDGESELVFDCDYELGDIEVEIDDINYIVKIIPV